MSMRLPVTIWTLGFVSLLMDISSEMIHSLLPVFLVTSLSASAFTVGLIEGAAQSTALVVKLFSGIWSDRSGRRKPLALLGYGLGALSKPLFALAPSVALILAARLIDRVGKGVRGAPRDALLAEIAPTDRRGAAFGLRQSLDTVGALLGPLLTFGLMALWAGDARAVFWVAVIPGFMAFAVLALGVREPDRVKATGDAQPAPSRVGWAAMRRLPGACWQVVAIGAVFTLARFSEAFLLLRAQQGGLALSSVPLVLVMMNAVYSASAYPFGRLADLMNRRHLLMAGLLVLIAADAVLAFSAHWTWIAGGVALWGLHMGMTQGLLAAMVADTAPPDLLGTSYGVFNLACGMSLLLASASAGWLWDSFGAESTFFVGAAWAALACVGLLWLGAEDCGKR